MNVFKRIFTLLMMAAILLLLVLLPKYIGALMLSKPSHIDWLKPKQEPYRGTISVWHIAEFKPYIGSVGSFLSKYGRTMEKRHFGVYFNVESMTRAEAEERLARGEKPDILSCMPHKNDLVEFKPLTVDTASNSFVSGEESLFALPYAASCRLILFYPSLISEEDINENAAEEHTFESFKAGKAPFCVADARAAGDMNRLVQMNKAELVEVLPCFDETELIYSVGISADIAEGKYPYALEFVELILSEKAQQTLTEIGLMPANSMCELRYEQDFLSSAYKAVRTKLEAKKSDSE